MSVSEFMGRISSIQSRFGSLGISPNADASFLVPGPTTAPTSGGLSEVSPAGAMNSVDLLTVLEQQRLEAGLSGTAASSGGTAHPLLAHPLLAHPLPGYDMGSGYGVRTHPITGDAKMHHGVDIGAPTGTPIQAVRDGEVSFAGERWTHGQLVIIDHGGGYESCYAHQSELDVVEGDWVTAGQIIGRVGSTGASTGPHLHFEIRRDGDSVDPAPLFEDDVQW